MLHIYTTLISKIITELHRGKSSGKNREKKNKL